MQSEPGLRERKKRRTREQIIDAAWRLFTERGFDAVSVAEIAREADVSEATVFNYFPAKEDLVFANLASFEEEVLATVRARPGGQSVVAAFGEFIVQPRGLLASDAPDTARIAAVARLIDGSRALLARERELWDRYTANLSALIAVDRGVAPGEVEPWVIANALIGIQRALVNDVRRQVLAGVDGQAIVRLVRVRGRRAVRLLEGGLDMVGRSVADEAKVVDLVIEPD